MPKAKSPGFFFIRFLLLFAILFILLGCTANAVSEDEQASLITIEDLAAQGIAVGTPSQAGASYTARRFINGTNEVEYEYNSAHDPANSTLVIFYSEADTLHNETLASEAFDDVVAAYLRGASFNTGEMEVIETPKAFTLGEQNYSAIFESNGVKIGNLVVARKGNLVYSFILAGPYIKYQETLENLIGPKLKRFMQ